MRKCYIGLGSNQQQPKQQLNDAIRALKGLTQLAQFRASSFYSSSPMGPQDQPDYVNAVAEFTWSGTEIELLDALQKIEQEQGRVRKAERWGPRTLDLDILLFGDLELESDRLTIPHYGMKVREFVLYPLAEIQPELTLPCGTHIEQLLKIVPLNGLHKLV
ncbi:2-amino-4-hydroxy-6-hydroxymethyldihydropteridine diphosphokinase [Catenovulum maritimum]|uniref:2-amino-4-hydroxy-6-hydroxymethyldihydropteridine pyrophosphokinase n=1 Tax=Catenovulum maritimum TaxID=1513271 RepID=A0A0J8GU00_9ALTE|nr:2-amino-4-hydroxy-6-hydroxymethyldihydropteridine diphosphokinase [Catenovulum maritimum]KMT66240.1 2-amino-4-hydroxy-6-hydroxymethyldihydropteridine pyrophosphokinase [Catenovulum maritimum]